MRNRKELTIQIAAQRTGLSTRTVRRYIRRGLLRERLSETELARLRRICRLTGLGVNLAGVEIILHMRRQILDLQVELAQLRLRPSPSHRLLLHQPKEQSEKDLPS